MVIAKFQLAEVDKFIGENIIHGIFFSCSHKEVNHERSNVCVVICSHNYVANAFKTEGNGYIVHIYMKVDCFKETAYFYANI